MLSETHFYRSQYDSPLEKAVYKAVYEARAYVRLHGHFYPEGSIGWRQIRPFVESIERLEELMKEKKA